MEKKNNFKTTTSNPEHHAVSPAARVYKGVKLVPNPKKQVKINPQHVSDVKESAVAVNRKFEDFLFEQHVKSKLTKPIAESLVKKSHKSGIPLQILEQVFNRGISSWNPYICKNASQEQWAFARVNSFIEGGKATELDEDLLEASRTFRSAETAERQSTDPNSPMSRLDGTKQIRKTFAKQTPGQLAKEETLNELEGFGKKILDRKRSGDASPCWTGYVQKGTKIKGGKVVPNCVKINEECAIDEEKEVWDKPNPKTKSKSLTSTQKARAKARAKAAGRPYPNLVDNMAVAKEETDLSEKSAAWQRKEGKNSEGGLNAKGRASYERENPGSDLKPPVSSEQAKKSPKAKNRRKSFCARMGGMPGPMKKDGKPTRKALALRKWDC